MRVIIVGGSLVGLTFALACSQRGISTLVLERSPTSGRSGGTLGIDDNLLMQATGTAHDANAGYSFPVLAGRRRAVTWRAVYDWLYAAALRRSEITLHDGVSVTHVVQQAGSVTAVAEDGRRFQAPLLVGADGYRSLVRQRIDPARSYAMYAGYLLWRGLVDESELPAGFLAQDNEGVALVHKGKYRLVAYPVARPGRSLQAGQRLLSFTWYDTGRSTLLHDLGCVDGSGAVLRSLAAENIPASVREELCTLARRIWPAPWREVIVHALERRRVFATPVAEYFPSRLVRGRLAILGDAAHVVSPIMGEGFACGTRDAQILAECLALFADTHSQAVQSALAAYEEKRLPPARSLVIASQNWSRAFVENHLGATSPRLRPVWLKETKK